MREMGVRGVLVYCADHHCSHSVALTRCGCPMSSNGSPARLADGVAPMSGRTSTGQARDPCYGVPMRLTADPEAAAREQEQVQSAAIVLSKRGAPCTGSRSS